MTWTMESIWDKAKASMEFYQKERREPKNRFEVGDKVWLLTTNIKTRRPTKKLDNKKAGPFPIKEKISSHAYRLKLPSTMKIHNVFHIELLTPVTEDSDFNRRQLRPAPVITEEGEEQWEVDHVVAWEKRKEGLFYQIRWTG